MSRAYRIRVRESLSRLVRAEDSVRAEIEMLPILSPAEMAELLAAELVRRGFERDGGRLRRDEGGISVILDLPTGRVDVRSATARQVELTETREELVDVPGDTQQQAEDSVRSALRDALEDELAEHKSRLRAEVSDRLAAALGSIRELLDEAIHRATAEALKQKAARIGRIRHLADDPENGSLTIVVEL